MLNKSILLALVLTFLLPFTTFTCGKGNNIATMSGVHLATGKDVVFTDPFNVEPPKRETLGANLYAILAIISSVTALGLVFVKRDTFKRAAGVSAVLCSLFLFALKSDVSDKIFKRSQGLIQTEWEFGYYIAILLSVIAAILLLVSRNKSLNTTTE